MLAIDEADVILFLVEVSTGITDLDTLMADILRRTTNRRDAVGVAQPELVELVRGVDLIVVVDFVADQDATWANRRSPTPCWVSSAIS